MKTDEICGANFVIFINFHHFQLIFTPLYHFHIDEKHEYDLKFPGILHIRSIYHILNVTFQKAVSLR